MRLQGHSYKPTTRFFGKGDYHLGLELELEAPNNLERDNGLELCQAPKYCYAKTDGSLNEYGWELVTHPITRTKWLSEPHKGCVKSFFNFVENLRQLGYTSHAGARCGLHIHVSYKAFHMATGVRTQRSWNGRPPMPVEFTNRKNLHLYWFMRLVNTNLFCKLSQRQRDQIDSWSTIIHPSTEDFHEVGIQTRYAATNITDNTVEVRIFRGNMRRDRIKKAIESVVAAIEFTRPFKSGHYKVYSTEKLLTDAFLGWIVTNKQTYTNLHSFLVETEIIQETAACA